MTGLEDDDENKTDDPRAFALEPDVVAALTWWKEHYRAKAKDDHPFFVRPDVTRFRVDGLCKRYREEHLPAAGVTRKELLVGSENKKRIAIRVHDLRAAFVTYALAGGRTETWVADRTGHRSLQMIERYRRRARTVAELGFRNLAPMDGAIPEIRARERKRPASRTASKSVDKKKSAGNKSPKSKQIGPIAQ